MRRIIVSLSLVTACIQNATAQQPMALSLQAAMDYAVKNNAAAKNARLDVQIQDAQNKQVTSLQKELGMKVNLEEVKQKVKKNFAICFDAELREN